MSRIFLFLLICCCYLEERAEAEHSFQFETSSLCSNNKRLPATVLILNTYNIKGKLCVYSEVEAKESFKGPIMMEMNLQRCTEDLSQCFTYPPIKFENVCNQFNTTFFGPELFTRVHPPLKCPIKPGKYLFNHTVTDFSNMSKGNVIPSKYKTKMLAFETKNGNRRQILCWNVILRISSVSSRKH